MRWRAKNPKSYSGNIPPRVLELFLSIGRIEFGAFLFEIVSMIIELLPLVIFDAVIFVTSLIWAIYEVFNLVIVLSEIFC